MSIVRTALVLGWCATLSMACGDESHSAGADLCGASGFEACGGDPVGMWLVADSCASDSFSLTEPDAPPECVGTKEATAWSLSGTVTYGPDGMFQTDLGLRMRVTLRITAECRAARGEAPFVTEEDCSAAEVSLSSTAGLSDVECTFDSHCECDYAANQPWVVADTYTTAGGAIEHSALVPLGNQVCVIGDSMQQRRSVDGEADVWITFDRAD